MSRQRHHTHRKAHHEPLHKRLDTVIQHYFPAWAFNREQARVRAGLARRAREGMERRRRAKGASHYQDARSGRLNRRRSSRGGSADSHATQSILFTLRENVRHLVDNSTLAEGLLQTDCDNVIGREPMPQAQTADAEWNREAEKVWHNEPLDVRGILPNSEFLRMLYTSVRRDGDLALIKSDGRFQALEAEFIATPTKYGTDDAVVNGIRFDDIGRPIEYYIATEHPTSAYVNKTTTRPAEDVIHIFRPGRFSASRGVPILAKVIDEIDRLNDYVEATVIAAQMAACYAIVRKTSYWPEKRGNAKTNDDTGDSERWEEVEPGMILYAHPDEEVQQLNPNHPNQQFETLVDTLCRFTGRHMGLPLELVLLNFSHSNFSNTRAALLQAQRTFENTQHWLDSGVFRQMWGYSTEHAIRRGWLQPHPEAAKVHFVMPGWPWVDPLKDIQADILALANGLRSPQQVASKWGVDAETVIEQVALYREMLARYGVEIEYTLRPGTQAAGGDDKDEPEESKE